MPFTPLHLGLGMVAKVIAPKKFSLLMFTGIQILMDIEPLIAMLLGWDTLHFYTHNLIGALLIGTIGLIFGKPMTEYVLNYNDVQIVDIPWSTAIFTAYFASFSHILLDAFMHIDMLPFFPLSTSQELVSMLSYPQLEAFCLFTLVIGVIGLAFRHFTHYKKT